MSFCRIRSFSSRIHDLDQVVDHVNPQEEIFYDDQPTFRLIYCYDAVLIILA